MLYQYKGTVSPSDADFVVKSDTVAIAAYAFNSQQSLKSVTLPNSVVQIGGYAFYNCMGLERVTLGSNVKIIGGGAFGWCKKLTSLVLPNSVQVIGQEAIGNCQLLTSVTFDGTLAELKEATTQTLFWYSKTNRELVITCTDGTFTPYHAPQAATADEDGNVEYWEDLKTGKKYSDDAYTQEISDVTVPAVGS